MNHLEETLKIEEKEKHMNDKLTSHKVNAAKEADLLSTKEKEKVTEQIHLQEEEGARKKLLKKMISDSNNSLSPITNVVVNLEG